MNEDFADERVTWEKIIGEGEGDGEGQEQPMHLEEKQIINFVAGEA